MTMLKKTNNWYKSLHNFQYAFISGLFAAVGGFSAIFLLNWLNIFSKPSSYWIVAGVTFGAYIGARIQRGRKEKNDSQLMLCQRRLCQKKVQKLIQVLQKIIIIMGLLAMAVRMSELFIQEISEKHSKFNDWIKKFAAVIILLSSMGWVLLSN